MNIPPTTIAHVPTHSGDANTRPATLAAISPLSVVKAIWDHKYLAAAIWLALTSVSVYVIYRLPAVYRAEAEILVESQRIPERYVSATVTPDLLDRLNGLSEQVLSTARLTEMIEKYGLYKEDRKHMVQEELVTKIRSDIAIKPTRSGPSGPGAFQVSYQGPDPVIVAQVANQIASFFIDENIRQRATEAEGASEFLQHQLAEAKTRLEQQEAMLSQYKLAHSGELPEQENALLSSIGQAKVQLVGVQDALNRAQQSKVMLESSLSDAQIASVTFAQTVNAAPSTEATGMAGSTAPAPEPQKASERLAAELAALTIRYSPQHPEVRRLKSELQRALDAEAASASAGPAPRAPLAGKPPALVAGPVRQIPSGATQGLTMNRERVETLKAQVAAADKQIEELNNERHSIQVSLGSLEAHIEKLPLREQQMASVTRDYETTKAAYQSLLDKKLAADVAADMEKRQKAERFVPIEMARVPEKPIKPKRQLLAAGAGLAALVLSMALVAALELRKGVLLGEWELPGSLIVLGRIPVMAPQPEAIWHSKFRRRGPVALAAIAMAVGSAGAYVGLVKL
jgi:polysaccharide biosynthesis transport protein